MKKIASTIALILSLIPTPTLAARLYTSGVEQQTPTTGEEFTQTGFFADANNGIDTSLFRSGAAAVKINVSASFSWFMQQFKASDSATEAFVRAYVRFVTLPVSGTADIFIISDASTLQDVRVYYDQASNAIKVADSTPTVIGTSAAISTGVWYRLEVDAIAGAGTGTVKAYLDGSSFASSTTATVNNFGRVYFGPALNTGTIAENFDDIAINNTSGASQTGLPGAGSIAMLSVTANGDDTPSGCDNTSPCADGNNFNRVDEVNPDDATSFVDLDTPGASASYNFTDTGTVGINSYDNITLIHEYVRQREEASAATLTAPFLKSASGGTKLKGTQTDSGTTTWRTSPTAGNNFMLNSLSSYTDPTTAAAWTPTGTNSVDSLIAGAWIGNTNDVDVSTIWVNVEYTAGTPPAAASSGGENDGDFIIIQ